MHCPDKIADKELWKNSPRACWTSLEEEIGLDMLRRNEDDEDGGGGRIYLSWYKS